jgi:IS5 family transposase
LQSSYRQLIGLTRRVATQAAKVLEDLAQGELVARPNAFLQVLRAERCVQHYLPLVEKVIAQSEARICRGETRHPGKILSLFEPHSVVIRKGKAHKPNEFGRLVRVDEVEHGLVSQYAIEEGMRRAFYQGAAGFSRYVGWSVIAHNLVALSRTPRQVASKRAASG